MQKIFLHIEYNFFLIISVSKNIIPLFHICTGTRIYATAYTAQYAEYVDIVFDIYGKVLSLFHFQYAS